MAVWVWGFSGLALISPAGDGGGRRVEILENGHLG